MDKGRKIKFSRTKTNLYETSFITKTIHMIKDAPSN